MKLINKCYAGSLRTEISCLTPSAIYGLLDTSTCFQLINFYRTTSEDCKSMAGINNVKYDYNLFFLIYVLYYE